jgi:hypothetical protein
MPDVDMRAGSRTGHRVTKCHKGDRGAAQVSHQRLAFGAVGTNGYIDSIVVIEA